MKLAARNVAWLLPLLLSACVHKGTQSQLQPLAPPIEDTPPLPPDSAPANLPQPVYSIPPTDQPVVVVQEPPKPPPKHHKPKPTTALGTTTAGQPTQVAAESVPPEVSAIDQVATKEAPDVKKQTVDSIAEIEKGLNGIGRKLSDSESKTETQIKEFLKQARTALASGDVDGALNLTLKAKVLLNELSQ